MSSDCQCQKCTWEPPKEVPEYILPNHIDPNDAQYMINVLKGEIAALRGIIDKLHARVIKLEGEQS